MGMLVSASRAPSSSLRVYSGRTPTRTVRNEFLHIEYAKQLTACVSLVLADHAQTLA